jgi:hypothetical protein
MARFREAQHPDASWDAVHWSVVGPANALAAQQCDPARRQIHIDVQKRCKTRKKQIPRVPRDDNA